MWIIWLCMMNELLVYAALRPARCSTANYPRRWLSTLLIWIYYCILTILREIIILGQVSRLRQELQLERKVWLYSYLILHIECYFNRIYLIWEYEDGCAREMYSLICYFNRFQYDTIYLNCICLIWIYACQIREETEHTMLRMLEEMCGKIQDDVRVSYIN